MTRRIIHWLFTADDSKLKQAMRDLNRRAATLKRNISNLGQVFRKVIVAAAGLGFIVKIFADFEHQMVRVQSLIGANAAEMEKLTAAARKAGRETEHTASSAAKGLGYLALAGYNATQAIAALPGILDLATAGQIDLGRAADLTTDILSAFGREAQEAGKVADILAAHQATANHNTEQLGIALLKVGPSARAAGISIEEAAAALSVMASAGLKAEQAGVALRRLADTLIANNKQLAAQGVYVLNSEGNFIGLGKTLKKFEERLRGTTDAERNRVVAAVGNTRAQRALNILVDQGSYIFEKYIEISRTAEGESRRMAAMLEGTLTGQWRQMVSAAQDAAIAFGEQLKPSAMGLIQAFKGLFRWISALPAPVLSVIVVIITVTLKLTLLAIAARGAYLVFALLRVQVLAMLPGLWGMITALRAGTISWKLFWGAATLGLTLFISFWPEIRMFLDWMARKFTEMPGWVQSITKLHPALAALGNALRKIRKEGEGDEVAGDDPRLKAIQARIEIYQHEAEAFKNRAHQIVKTEEQLNKALIQLKQERAAAYEYGDEREREAALAAIDVKEQAINAALAAQATRRAELEDQAAQLARDVGLEWQESDWEILQANDQRIAEHEADRRRAKFEAELEDRENWRTWQRDDLTFAENIEGLRKTNMMKSTRAFFKDAAVLRDSGNKQLRAIGKAAALADLALDLATRPPEAYATTSAAFPWPLGAIMGGLHAGVIVAGLTDAMGKVAGFAQGGIVGAGSLGRRDDRLIAAERGEMVVARNDVPALMASLRSQAAGGGARVIEVHTTLELNGKEIAQNTAEVLLEEGVI